MRRRWLVPAVLACGLLVGLLLTGHSLEADGSTLSRGPGGWMAARRYLELRGTATELLREPLEHAVLPRRDLLVVTFPWQGTRVDDPAPAIANHLAGGGDLLLAYSADVMPSPREEELLEALGAAPGRLSALPVSPWRWKEAAAEVWELRTPDRGRLPRLGDPRQALAARRAAAANADGGGSDAAGAPESGEGAHAPAPATPTGLHLRRPRWMPYPPSDSALLVAPDGRTVVASWAQGRGRVLLVPAELLCNARLAEPAHAALLESLRKTFGNGWHFDELHHGFAGEAVDAVSPATRRGFDLLLIQLGLIYAAAALALGRRLGPAWRETATIAGSAAGFLVRLGSLHHRLGHHRAGAELLLRRAVELDRRLVLDDELQRLAERGDAAALVELGKRVATAQRGG